MVAAALRRLAVLLLVLTAGTVVLSLAMGQLLGSGVSRSISVGFYLVGSFLLISGFFVGNRGPVRPKGESIPFMGPIVRNRGIRVATHEEREESLSLSVVFVVLGVVLIIVGALADTRYQLY